MDKQLDMLEEELYLETNKNSILSISIGTFCFGLMIGVFGGIFLSFNVLSEIPQDEITMEVQPEQEKSLAHYSINPKEFIEAKQEVVTEVKHVRKKRKERGFKPISLDTDPLGAFSFKDIWKKQ